jgi:lipoate-protein ligase A
VTYSVVAPYSLFGDRDPRSAYCAVHAVIAAALEALGVPLEARTGSPARATTEGRCFSNPTDYDLVAGQRKLVGSAQRRKGQAFLQHGSLPLTTDPEAPGATSISELLGRPIDPRIVEEAILAATSDRLAERLLDDAPRETERAQAERIERERYSARSWTLDR